MSFGKKWMMIKKVETYFWSQKKNGGGKEEDGAGWENERRKNH